jgi:hypothetical protein
MREGGEVDYGELTIRWQRMNVRAGTEVGSGRNMKHETVNYWRD